MCRVKVPLSPNFSVQIWHSNIFCFSWTVLLCLSKLPFNVNLWVQSLQSKGRMLSCSLLMCLCKWILCLNFSSQTWHSNGLKFKCLPSMCNFKLDGLANVDGHFSHWKVLLLILLQGCVFSSHKPESTCSKLQRKHRFQALKLFYELINVQLSQLEYFHFDDFLSNEVTRVARYPVQKLLEKSFVCLRPFNNHFEKLRSLEVSK